MILSHPTAAAIEIFVMHHAMAITLRGMCQVLHCVPVCVAGEGGRRGRGVRGMRVGEREVGSE